MLTKYLITFLVLNAFLIFSNSVKNEQNIFEKLYSHNFTKTIPRSLIETIIPPTNITVSILVSVSHYGPRYLSALFQWLSLLSNQINNLISNLEIILYPSGFGEIQYEILNLQIESWDQHFKFVDFYENVHSASVSSNKASMIAKGQYLLFISDLIEKITIDQILEMVKVLMLQKIGLVMPTLVNSSQASSVIYSTGLELIYGPNPHKMGWNPWYVNKLKKKLNLKKVFIRMELFVLKNYLLNKKLLI